MVKKVGNLIPNTFFITKGSGDSDLESMQVLITWLFMMPVFQTLTL